MAGRRQSTFEGRGRGRPTMGLPAVSDEDRQSYFWRRAREARDLAAEATDERARLVHTEMAVRYQQQAEGKGPCPR